MELLALSSVFLRLLTLVIGVIDFGITVDSYQHHFRSEEFFLSVISFCLLLSAFFVLVILGATTGFLKRSNLMKILDLGYHILATLFLFIGGVLFIVSVKNFGSGSTPVQRTYYSQRLASGILGIINSIIYFNICWMSWCMDRPYIIRKQEPEIETY